MFYLIITSCLNNRYGIIDFEDRKKRYINCIETAKLINKELNNQIKIIIVENNGSRNTFLDELEVDVLYTENNKYYCPNPHLHKGVVEFMDIKDVINKYNIHDDDIVIKLTGRYKLLNSNFLKLILENNNNYDVFMKFFNVSRSIFKKDDCVMGLYGIRCKYLKEFQFNLPRRSAECNLATFIRENINNDKICEVNTLNLECKFADDHRIANI
tara:strand:+ start:145 stop:783 length:639 start_codon:yes stop_codon:yes gene_type:complete